MNWILRNKLDQNKKQIWIKYNGFLWRKHIWTSDLQNIGYFVMDQTCQPGVNNFAQKNVLTLHLHVLFVRDTDSSSPNWPIYLIMLGTPNIHQPGYSIMIVVDILVPNSHQAISNHYANSAMTIPAHQIAWHRYHVTTIKQCLREAPGLTTLWFLCH